MAITIADRTVNGSFSAKKFYSKAPTGGSTALYNHFVMFGGQSNSVGAARADSPAFEMPGDLAGQHPKVQFWRHVSMLYGDMTGDATGGFNVNGAGNNAFGLEMRLMTDLAEELGATTDDPIFGFKYALGSTAAAFRTSGGRDITWNPHEGAAEHLNLYITKCAEAIAALPDQDRPLIIYPLLWDQGEEDARTSSIDGDDSDWYITTSRIVFEIEYRLGLMGIHTAAIRPFMNGQIEDGTANITYPRRDGVRGVESFTSFGVTEFVASNTEKRFMIDRDRDQGANPDIDYRTTSAPFNENDNGVHVSGAGFDTLAPIVTAAFSHRCIMLDATSIVAKGLTLAYQDLTGGKYQQTRPLRGDAGQVQAFSSDISKMSISRNSTEARAPDGTFTAHLVEIINPVATNYYLARLKTSKMTPVSSFFPPFEARDNANMPLTIWLKPLGRSGGDIEVQHKSLRFGFSEDSYGLGGAFFEALAENSNSTVTIDTNEWKEYEIENTWGIAANEAYRQGGFTVGSSGSQLNGDTTDVPGHSNACLRFLMWRVDSRIP